MLFLTILTWLILGHFVCDYPLQTDFIAKYKSRLASLPAVPWYYVMAGHAATHGAAVGLITGSPLLAISETMWHFAIDCRKCEGKTNIHVDQAMHIACKIVWAWMFVIGIK